MAKKNFTFHLKGYVGGWDFDRGLVDYMLSKNEGKEVCVLIDSLGGSLATALSITAAFKNHGNVSVHYVGMNASAATIASMGAKHISIESSAMYLVHKCSSGLFNVGSFNADQLQDVIKEAKQMKNDLDKMDANIAELYASRCKKKPEDLLALMKKGGWLTAREALEWGFVDEISDSEDATAPVMTDALASAMATAGIPLPNIPCEDKNSPFAKFLSALTALFTSRQATAAVAEEPAPVPNTNPNTMKKTFALIGQLLALEALTFTDGHCALTEEQADMLEASLAARDQKIKDTQATLTKAQEDHATAIKDKDATIADLQAQIEALKKAPGADTTHVVDDKGNPSGAKTDEEAYIETINSARALYDELP